MDRGSRGQSREQPRPPEAPTGRASPRAVGLAGFGVVVLACAVVASAGRPVAYVDAGPDRAGGAPVPLPPPTTLSTQTPDPRASGLAPLGGGSVTELPPFVITLVQGVFLLLVTVAAAFLLRWLARVLPRLSSSVTTSAPLGPLPDVGPDPVSALTDTAGNRTGLLATGSPRNAIVACWVDLEQTAERVGLPRHPAETPTEFTRRVIGAWLVSPDALDGLAALYREARFSRHPVDESHRASALAHLERLHADLRSGR